LSWQVVSRNGCLWENFCSISFIVSSIERKEDIQDKEQSWSYINSVVEYRLVECFIDIWETERHWNENRVEDCDDKNK
jgi:hypothetical protein